MTAAKILLRRCIILVGIFVCYAHAWSDDYIDCEKSPFHYSCRGSMSKKRTMMPIQTPNCDDSREDADCSNIQSKAYDVKQRIVPDRIMYGTYPRSKLWTSLVNGLSTDGVYDVYTSNYDRHHKKKRNNKKEKYATGLRRIPAVDNRFLADLENLDSDY